ncbi:hypothetical protein [Paenibacillus pasadenensis]|uniref:hypothetical protein n=1 Tax=Paenibacillus pasadenensis TaxID=217090 RepID=UPI000C79CB4D|nr:hypothetical protein [Paenibacillus pasadenensis]
MVSKRCELIKQYPLCEDLISIHEFLGYTLATCRELEMDRHHGEHLAAQALLLLNEVQREDAEDAYLNSSSLAQKQGLGIKEILNWNKSKARISKPVGSDVLKMIASNRALETETLTEQEAAGYLLLAALRLNFIREQLTPLEMEFNYQLRVLEPDVALEAGLHFLKIQA